MWPADMYPQFTPGPIPVLDLGVGYSGVRPWFLRPLGLQV